LKNLSGEDGGFMKYITLKKLISTATLGLVVLLGTGEMVNAQTYRTYRQYQLERQREIQRQQRQYERQQRQYQRQQQRAINRQYRIYNNGRYYTTDDRGVELLRQAVNSGYQQGYQAGQQDRAYGRRGNYAYSNLYRSGNYGYQSYVDSSQYRYYFQQGFERGYQDGYNRRYQYGYNSNGGLNILGSILQTILNIQPY
jgi:flagellar biosynthesis/type III secretory pathway protein FliH